VVPAGREYLGFHTFHSGNAGKEVGRKVSENVVKYLKQLFSKKGECREAHNY